MRVAQGAALLLKSTENQLKTPCEPIHQGYTNTETTFLIDQNLNVHWSVIDKSSLSLVCSENDPEIICFMGSVSVDGCNYQQFLVPRVIILIFSFFFYNTTKSSGDK